MTGAPRGRGGELARFWELAVHLARREVTSRHRWTLLGWMWPLTRQLAQLGVLVFVFSGVVDLGIDDYPVFVFTGLLAFTWFSAGLSEAASSLVTHRHLVFQTRFPPAVIPVVSVAVPLVDVIMGLPVLLVMVALTHGLDWTALLLPPLLAVQFVLMCGLAWLCSAATVYLRDVPQVVLVGLTLIFYVTPVFYDLDRVPERYRSVLELNPLATLIEAYRAVLLGGSGPSGAQVAILAAATLALVAAGVALFRRLQSGFVDEL
ncbi:MAG: lipopolysaccharide transport system permease protein [Thermoleophilaceae bacterium]|jgi:lipopolysaccharide transport system permease protein|nr:lipopolysaccharide transport system permease protein [Thermoleophilaceae bacterium]